MVKSQNDKITFQSRTSTEKACTLKGIAVAMQERLELAGTNMYHLAKHKRCRTLHWGLQGGLLADIKQKPTNFLKRQPLVSAAKLRHLGDIF